MPVDMLAGDAKAKRKWRVNQVVPVPGILQFNAVLTGACRRSPSAQRSPEEIAYRSPHVIIGKSEFQERVLQNTISNETSTSWGKLGYAG